MVTKSKTGKQKKSTEQKKGRIKTPNLDKDRVKDLTKREQKGVRGGDLLKNILSSGFDR
ncbi:MAG: hypothetical protein ABJB97_13035 [Acidobacteriota bacterium]